MPHSACRKLSSPFVQYLLGVSLNLLYVLILLTNDTSYRNVQLPLGVYRDNLWKGTDVLTYVGPATNFVYYGTFGSGSTPDYHRTIGYPLFLSVFMLVFDKSWLLVTLFAQALIFALLYPAICRTSNILFNSSPRASAFSFSFFLLSGTYLVMVPVILTDLFFAVFFTIGFCFGLEAIVRKSWILLTLQIAFIGYAAQVRPTLSYYAVVNLCFLLYVACKNHNVIDKNTYKLVAVSSLLLLVLGNLPSFRNYVNHGFFKPTDVLSNGMFDYLGYSVSSNHNEFNEYAAVYDRLKNETDISKGIEIKEQAALRIFERYPLTTLFTMSRNAIGVMARGHWAIAANFWGYNFKDLFQADFMPRKRSEFVYIVEIVFNIVYVLLYILSCAYLVRLWQLREYTLLFAMLLFLSSFLLPAFMIFGAGSRLRLPVEGLLVSIAFIELEFHLEFLKTVLSRLRK